MWSTELTYSSFVFTVLREMYGQRNSSGACVHFNKHGSKTNLYNCNNLKYAIQFWRNCCFKAFVSLNIKRLVSEASRMYAIFMRSVRWYYWILNKIVTSQGITVNIRNIQIHNNAFSISPVVTWRRTDRNV